MQKRKIIIVIGVIVIILLGFLGYGYLTKVPSTGSGQATGTNFFSTIFPFLNTNNAPGNSLLSMIGLGGKEEPAPQAETFLKKVSSFPVAGYGLFNKERFIEVPPVTPLPVDTTSVPVVDTTKAPAPKEVPKPIAPPTEFVPAVNYVEIATGNIYQTYADKIEERQLAPNVIPMVHDAFFGKNGVSAIMRYLKGNTLIETFIKALPKEVLGADAVAPTAVGSFLPENITDLTMSPDASQIFYLFNIQNGSVGITTDALGINKTQVFNSAYTEWLAQWPNDKMITLTTKPSSGVPGYMYAVDPTKKDFNKILGNINGLTTLTSPDGTKVLYSSSNLSLYIYDIATGNSQYVGLNTLPEKCVWTKGNDKIYCAVPRNMPAGNYPDSWYMGEISFADDIWSYDMTSNNTSLVLDNSGGEDIDMVKLSVDDNQKYLFFINKKDSYLWEFSL